MTWLAWLAPWLFGMGTWVLACGWPRRHGEWCGALGGGWLLGMLLLGWLLWALHGVLTPVGCVHGLGPWLLVAGVLMIGAGWQWRRGTVPVSTDAPLRGRWLALAVVLLALLILRTWWMYEEAVLPPVFPWDAWTAWSVKPKTWYLLDQWVRFVDYPQWLAGQDPHLYTNEVPAYPEWLGRIETWFAAGAGCWCDPAFTVLWPTLWLALLLTLYGMLRGLGTSALVAVLAIYALGSLPLLDVHGAMAGYADLWLAAFFALGMLHWLRWQREHAPGACVLALAMILSLPAIKVEGAVWMLLALMAMMLGLVPQRWRLRVALIGVAVGAALLIALLYAHLRVPVPGLGTIYVDRFGLHIPGLRPMRLGWHAVGPAALRSLLVVSNWHLLFYLAPILIIARWRQACAANGLGLLGLCLLGGLAFLFVLFFLTVAGIWADNFTSLGRLLLQAVPLLVCYVALLFAGPRPDRAAA
jgi:hypothetical protein